MSLAKKLKMIVKGERKPTFGTDPNEPWSVRAGITESESSMLGSYLKSRGINPEFVSKDTKISHAKSTEFSKWKRDHMFDDPADTVSSVARDKMKSQREEIELDETMTKEDKDPCWTGYTQVGMKKKNGREVPNCVPSKGVEKAKGYKEEVKEAKTIQGTALDKFRQAAAERAKKHDDVEKQMKSRQAAGKEDMKGSIDRLEKQLNKEESLSELNYDTVKSLYKKRRDDFHGPEVGKKKKGKEVSAKNVSRSISRLTGFKPTQNQPQKEEFHQSDIDEAAGISKTKETSFHKKLDKLVHNTFGKRKDEMKKEDVFQDTQAATQTAFDMGTQADDREPTYSRKKEMSKSARMIKSLYKKHKMVKEELYDHEKEDKSVATYGKKPKVEKVQVDGDENNQAAMVLKGGKTLTGQTRDTLEIDPVMKKPSNPDNKNNSTKTDK